MEAWLEWIKADDLKSSDVNASVGSNPTASELSRPHRLAGLGHRTFYAVT